MVTLQPVNVTLPKTNPQRDPRTHSDRQSTPHRHGSSQARQGEREELDSLSEAVKQAD